MTCIVIKRKFLEEDRKKVSLASRQVGVLIELL